MKRSILFAGIMALATGAMAQEKPVLTVYTYDSFISDWGPGPQVEAAFEETCGCDLQFVGVGDGAALLARLRLEGSRSKADVVLGLDTNLIANASDTGLFAEHAIKAEFDLPITWNDPVFLPFDWGYFAFVYDSRKVSDPPKSFEELANSDLKIVIEDPRTSTPGLGLLFWIRKAYGDKASQIWRGLFDNIVTVTKSWSGAYSMFLDGEADMVLSYTTSPAYHLIAENDDTKAAAAFNEGHYMQIEVAARLAGSDQPELAEKFLRFMLSDAFQKIIPTTNWMYPAVMPEEGLPKGYETLIKPEKALIYSAGEAQALRNKAMEEWRQAANQ